MLLRCGVSYNRGVERKNPLERGFEGEWEDEFEKTERWLQCYLFQGIDEGIWREKL